MAILSSIIQSKVVASVIGPEGIGEVGEINQVVGVATIAANVVCGPVLISAVARAFQEEGPTLSRKNRRRCPIVRALGIAVGRCHFVVPGPHASSQSPWPHHVHTTRGSRSCPREHRVSDGRVFLVGQSDIKSLTINGLMSTILGAVVSISLPFLYGLKGQFIAEVATSLIGALVAHGSMPGPCSVSAGLGLELPQTKLRRRWGRLGRCLVRQGVTMGITITSFQLIRRAAG